MINFLGLYLFILLVSTLAGPIYGQATKLERAAAIQLGSRTARGGFRNETEIAAKFNNWRVDAEARIWLSAMNYTLADIENVLTAKPHGEKADVQVRVKTKFGEFIEGMSIKLVSSPNGFNQIDKRWLATYSRMWKMPADVSRALRYFAGELPPTAVGRDAKRMYLTELDAATQQRVVDFFKANKDRVVSDILKGDGVFAAGWMLVAWKPADKPRWMLRKIDDVIAFYKTGPVVITRNGNLKIGRVTMQRKGGDAGRETAKMLQFKINPAELFEAK
ncbi:MAG: type II restriction endonuclease [Acidobacteria bacterium]|nr:type II restriction endonuclease [Acidobacteriota bacterium]